VKLPLALSPWIETSSPLSSLNEILPFLTSSRFRVTVLPLDFSRSVMSPLSSSTETTSTSGFMDAISLAIATAGFLRMRAGSRPACLAL
jgi:hypothetical protein